MVLQNTGAYKADLDISVIRSSIDIGHTMINQILQGIHNGTKEVRSLLCSQCDYILECKICRNLFRSFASLVAHKRMYCRETFEENVNIGNRNQTRSSEEIVVITPEAPEEGAKVTKTTTTSNKAAANNLKEKQHDGKSKECQIIKNVDKNIESRTVAKVNNENIPVMKLSSIPSNPNAVLVTRRKSSPTKLNQSKSHSLSESKTEDKNGKMSTESKSIDSICMKLASQRLNESESTELVRQTESSRARQSNVSARKYTTVDIHCPPGKSLSSSDGTKPTPAGNTGVMSPDSKQADSKQGNLDEKKCKRCGAQFLTQSSLTAHLSRHGLLVGEFKCPKCTKKFFHASGLRRHLRVQHKSVSSVPNSIKQKKSKFIKIDQRENRLKSFRSSPKKSVENVDKMSEAVNLNFKSKPCHTLLHSKTNAKSDPGRMNKSSEQVRQSQSSRTRHPNVSASKVTTGDLHLTTHLSRHALFVGEFKCPKCSKKFSLLDSLRRHLREKHGTRLATSKLIACRSSSDKLDENVDKMSEAVALNIESHPDNSVLHSKTNAKSDLDRMNESTEQVRQSQSSRTRHPNVSASKVTTGDLHLTSHLSRHALLVGELKCPKCSKKFSLLDSLRRHLREKHGTRLATSKLIACRSSSDKLDENVDKMSEAVALNIESHPDNSVLYSKTNAKSDLDRMNESTEQVRQSQSSRTRQPNLSASKNTTVDIRCPPGERLSRSAGTEPVPSGSTDGIASLDSDRTMSPDSDKTMSLDSKLMKQDKPATNHLCKTCGAHFRSQFTLTTHLSRHGLLVGKFKCPKCTKKFFHVSGLRRHLREKHRTRISESILKTFKSSPDKSIENVDNVSEAVNLNIKSKPDTTVLHSQTNAKSDPDRMTESTEQVRQSQSSRTRQPNVSASKVTTGDLHLTSHLSRHALLVGEFKCPKCSKKFSLLDSLRRHLREKHGTRLATSKLIACRSSSDKLDENVDKMSEAVALNIESHPDNSVLYSKTNAKSDLDRMNESSEQVRQSQSSRTRQPNLSASKNSAVDIRCPPGKRLSRSAGTEPVPSGSTDGIMSLDADRTMSLDADRTMSPDFKSSRTRQPNLSAWKVTTGDIHCLPGERLSRSTDTKTVPSGSTDGFVSLDADRTVSPDSDKTMSLDSKLMKQDKLATNLLCKTCGAHFQSQFTLTTHLSRHGLLVGEFKCPKCSKKFFQLSGLRRHLREKHRTRFSESKLKTFRSSPDKSDKNVDKMSKAVNLNIKNNPDNTVLHSQTIAKSDLDRMNKSSEQSQSSRSRQPNVSARKVTSEDIGCPHREIHFRSSGTKPVPSGSMSTNPKLMKQSKLTTNYLCKKCGAYLGSQFALTAHLSRHGLLVGKFKCPKCTKQFFHASGLRRHLRVQHRTSIKV